MWRPILREHCFSCHSADKQESGLQLDSYQKAMAGGSSGEVVLPGDLASSRLWALVSHAEEPKMPPKQDKLAAVKLDILSKWIEQGGAGKRRLQGHAQEEPAGGHCCCHDRQNRRDPSRCRSVCSSSRWLITKRPGQTTALADEPLGAAGGDCGAEASRALPHGNWRAAGSAAISRRDSTRRSLQSQRQCGPGGGRARRPNGLRRAV